MGESRCSDKKRSEIDSPLFPGLTGVANLRRRHETFSVLRIAGDFHTKSRDGSHTPAPQAVGQFGCFFPLHLDTLFADRVRTPKT
jgi:hypothetical protein